MYSAALSAQSHTRWSMMGEVCCSSSQGLTGLWRRLQGSFGAMPQMLDKVAKATIGLSGLAQHAYQECNGASDSHAIRAGKVKVIAGDTRLFTGLLNIVNGCLLTIWRSTVDFIALTTTSNTVHMKRSKEGVRETKIKKFTGQVGVDQEQTGWKAKAALETVESGKSFQRGLAIVESVSKAICASCFAFAFGVCRTTKFLGKVSVDGLGNRGKQVVALFAHVMATNYALGIIGTTCGMVRRHCRFRDLEGSCKGSASLVHEYSKSVISGFMTLVEKSMELAKYAVTVAKVNPWAQVTLGAVIGVWALTRIFVGGYEVPKDA